MPTFAKAFEAGATTANTIKNMTPTGGWIAPPGSWNIFKAIVGYANIVNAKETSGFLIITKNNGRKYVFAFGGGTGGATNAGQFQADDINVSIPLTGGDVVTVDVLTAEVVNDTRVSLVYREGNSVDCMTLAAGGAGQDLTAGTELTLTANSKLSPITLVPWRNGSIREIRVTGGGLVDALSQAVRISLDIGGQPNTFEFVAFAGPGGAATAIGCNAAVIKDLDIPVTANGSVNVRALTTVTTGSAIQSLGISLTCS